MTSDSRVMCFLCRCHGEVGGAVDLESVRNRLLSNPAVASCEVWDSLCLKENLTALSERISSSGGRHAVLGACSLYSRGDVVINGLEHRGVSPDAIELVDIREGCSWIHRDNPAAATAKALDLMRMAVAARRHRQASDDVHITASAEVLVIGAGPAGIAAAACLERLGMRVHLIDRAKALGGMLNLIDRTAPEESVAIGTAQRIRQISDSDLVTFYPGARLVSLQGSAGDYAVEIASGGSGHTIRAGAVIVATGAKILMPDGLYRHSDLRGVITGIELERRFKTEVQSLPGAVFVQCAGVRDETRPYCSSICCLTALKQARRLLEANPRAHVYIMHRDVMCPGSVLENYYRESMSLGVRFVRFDPEKPPVVLGQDEVEAVEVYDALTAETRRIETSLVVLSSPLTPHDDAGKLAGALGLGRDAHGFFQVRSLMHPVETMKSGLFVCGSARWPVLARTAVLQGEAAAMKAHALLSGKSITASSLSQYRERKFSLARVNQDACTGCGNCVAACPYDACTLQAIDGAYKSSVDPVRCSGCGTCASVCPNGSIQLPELNAAALGEKISTAFSSEREENV